MLIEVTPTIEEDAAITIETLSPTLDQEQL